MDTTAVVKPTVVSTSNEAPLVNVIGFEKRYRRQTAVNGVDLQINPGAIYGLLGPDGAGKSSLMKAVAGVLTFDAGRVEVFDVNVDSERSAEKIKDRIGFMPQGLGLNLYPDLSVEENVDFFARVRLVSRAELRKRKTRLLEMTRLDRFRDRPMKKLSGGMKQKLGLVSTLIHQPKLIVLDEPTTGIDPVSRQDFWAVLAELLEEEDITALISTAYLEEATRFHRVSLMHDGKVIAEGDPDSILELAPGNNVIVSVEPQLEAIARLQSGFTNVEAFGSDVEVFVENSSADSAVSDVRRSLSGMTISDIRVKGAELEDVYLALVRRQQKKTARVTSTIELVRSVECADPVSSEGDAIEAMELVRDFGDFRAVDHTSFKVQSGEIFGLLGANGAGKTTVIKMLTGILKTTSGHVRLAGYDMRKARKSIKRNIGYMSQAFSLYQDMTVMENIRLYAGIYGLGRTRARQCIDTLLAKTDLSEHSTELTGRLPVGVRQRLALACALVHEPQILFLDEPTSGVDPDGRRFFWELLFALSRNNGVTILVTTHYMTEAEHCDRLALMFDGRVVADAAPSELKADVEKDAGKLLSINTDAPLKSIKHLKDAGYENVSLFGKRIHMLAHDLEGTKARIHNDLQKVGVHVDHIEQQPLTMENVFVHRVLQLERAGVESP